jgi:very-short-patch-repair endonuclease
MVTARTFRGREANKTNLVHARSMRHAPVSPEKKFWSRVRDRRLGGHKFKRQVLIGSYIADFVCIERKLIVELDGGQHADRKAYDEKRDAFLTDKGFRVIRVWNIDLTENIDGVMEMVLGELECSPSPSP